LGLSVFARALRRARATSHRLCVASIEVRFFFPRPQVVDIDCSHIAMCKVADAVAPYAFNPEAAILKAIAIADEATAIELPDPIAVEE
jgi:hypothetical protein